MASGMGWRQAAPERSLRIEPESIMKTELLYLLLTSILTGVLWIPVVIGYVSSRGIPTPSDYT